MPASSPAAHLSTAPATELITLLLQQFKRPFVEQGIDTSPEGLQPLIDAASAHQPLPDTADAIRTLLRSIIRESEATLRDDFGFTFAESLHKTMEDVTGWTSTAEFLDRANDKSTAELRISTASILLAFLGDPTFLSHVRTVIEADEGLEDVDGVLAKRALQHLEASH
jgi:hypothetical protein